MAMGVDEAIALCGDCSKWHILMFTMLGITSIFPSCWQMLAIIFIGEYLLQKTLIECQIALLSQLHLSIT
jgi:hypothetical protein